MKKATAPTVAQSIKSTKQLSQLQGLAPAKSCKPPLKSSCSALQIDAAQAKGHAGGTAAGAIQSPQSPQGVAQLLPPAVMQGQIDRAARRRAQGRQ